MSERTWFYAFDGKQQGPLSEAELRDLLVTRVVGADTLVWSEGMSSWTKAGEVPGLLTDAQRPAEPSDQSAARLDPSFASDDASQRWTAPAEKIQELDISLGRLLRIYWLFAWRGVLGSVLIGFVLGFATGFVLGGLGGTLTQTRTISGAVGLVVGLIWSIVCLRMALSKKYSDFRIVLAPREIE